MQIVIEIDEAVKKRFCSGLGVLSDFSAVADALYKGTPLPSWIPTRERLPLLRGPYKTSEDVLITNGFEIFMGYLVERRKGKISWIYYDSGSEVDVGSADDDVTAWMPLPDPYKAESEEKT